MDAQPSSLQIAPAANATTARHSPSAPPEDLLADSLWAAAGVFEGVALIKEMHSRYAPPGIGAEQHAHTLSIIEKRIQRSAIQLGAIGEFSAGKTTLINALFGFRLLPADTLQGTTAATTLIEYSTKPRAVALSRDGASQAIEAASLNDQPFMEFVDRHISNEAVAARLQQLCIGVPSPFLQHGVTLIDTPGLNSLNDRHTSVAVEAIKDLCDAFLVVIPATSPLPETTLRFLTTHLTGKLHRCIFVVTKSDLLSRDEEAAVCQSIRDRLEAGLQLPTSPHVMGCSAEIALAMQLGRDPNEGRPRQLDAETLQERRMQFNQFRDQLLATIALCRQAAVLESALDMLRGLLDSVNQRVVTAQESHRKQHSALEAKQSAGFEALLAEHERAGLQGIKASGLEAIEELRAECERQKEQALAAVTKASAISTDPKRTKSHVAEAMQHCFVEGQRVAHKATQKAVADLAQRVAGRLKHIETAFEKQFSALATLDNAISPLASPDLSAAKQVTVRPLGESPLDQANTQWSVLEQEVEKGESRIGAGFMIGGLLGLYISPWGFLALGKLIGGAIGVAAGCFVASLLSQRTELKPQDFEESGAKAIKDSFGELRDACATQVMEAQAALMQTFRDAAASFGSQYQELSLRMQDRDQKESERLAGFLRQTEIDLSRISNQAALIRSAKDKCMKRWSRAEGYSAP
jgi:tRNA U34 5-carboxymethylaminomethyl modifying GTPase MnmE/TrmE/gas vesicle protein